MDEKPRVYRPYLDDWRRILPIGTPVRLRRRSGRLSGVIYIYEGDLPNELRMKILSPYRDGPWIALRNSKGNITHEKMRNLYPSNRMPGKAGLTHAYFGNE